MVDFFKNRHFTKFNTIFKNEGMKQIGKLFILGVVFGALLISQGCKKSTGPGETIEDVQLGKLSKKWTKNTVTLDGVDQTGYDNFTLTISGTAGNTSFGYKAEGRPQLSSWPSDGTWKFGATPETTIVRDPDTQDALNVTYSVTETQLQITYTFSGAGYQGGRTAKVNGVWVFTFQ